MSHHLNRKKGKRNRPNRRRTEPKNVILKKEVKKKRRLLTFSCVNDTPKKIYKIHWRVKRLY